MSAKSKAGLGIHIGVAGVRASLATGGQIAHLPLPESAGTVLSWLRISGGRLACVTAPELLGVEGAENAALHSLQAVFRALKQAIDPQVREQLQVAIAVPRILPEPQRRRLLFTAQECFGQARLIDSTTAALHASPALQAEGSGPSIAVVAEDPALEMCISAPEGEDNKILGYRSIREFSGHALHHHLLQLTIDRLPATRKSGSLVAIASRMARSSARLG